MADQRSCGRLVLALLAVALLSACASVAPLPLPPTPGPVAHLPPVPESVVGVHLSAGYPAMGAAVSAAVPVKFANVSATDLGRLVTFDLVGTRSDIVLARAADKIGFGANVQIDGSLGADCRPIADCTSSLHMTGRVSGVAKPTINPDWSISLDSTAQYRIDDADLSFPFLPKAVSVKDALSQVLQAPFDDLVTHINTEVARSAVLKTDAAAAWSALGPPIQVSTSPSIWLVVHPTRILTEQPAISDQGVGLGVALIARPELVVGDKPDASDPGPLPNLTLVDQIPQQFSIFLPVRLTWDDATAFAQQTVAGKPLNAGGGVSVLVDRVSIFNNGDEVGVKIAFRANSMSGTLYLLGKPVYHLADGYISVENLHLDISTQNLMLRLATWLTHQSLIDDLQSRLHFDVKSQVEARRQDLDKAINGAQVNPRISLAGQVTSLAPSAVYLTQQGLQVNVVALGTLNVVLH